MRAADWLIAGALAILTLVFYSIHLGALEFFRHTEADRTLIAWEMVETKSYLVPHLLGSPILTKPPLFYWLVAFSISSFGSAAEWVARFPSVVCGSLLVAFEYLFLRFLAFETVVALGGALMIGTGAAFQEFGTVAEIDMLYGCLSGVAFSLGFLAIERRSLVWTILAYLTLAVAFLAKGPPALVFFLVGFVLFFVWAWRAADRSGLSRVELRRIALFQVVGVIAGLLPIALWAAALASQVGWASLGREVHIEIFERIVSRSPHHHGVFFYALTFVVMLLPWTFVLLAGIFMQISGESWKALENPRSRRFLVWNLAIAIPAAILLTFAAGKSNRYLFPVYVPAMNVAFLALFSLRGSIWERRLFACGKFLGVTAAIAGIVAPLFVHFDGASKSSVWSLSLIASALGACLFTFLRLGLRSDAFLALCLIMCLVQVGKTEIFAPVRNKDRSVKQIASEINETVPKDENIYTLELFDRWVSYYLKRMGRNSVRISPAVAEGLRASGGKRYLLLEYEDEGWRWERIRSLDPSARLVKEFPDPKEHLLLVETDAEKLPLLRPHEFFPTVPSLPY